MSVFDGEIEFQSVYMVDYAKKVKPKSPRRKAVDDNCLIVGLSRDSLRAKEAARRCPDVLCPLQHEYYKDAVVRFKDDYPKLTKKYMSKELDPTPIEHEIQDLKRTEYLTKYCSRELPFMSVNLARRARALQTLRLPDDIYIPDTSQKGSYRAPKPEKYAEPPSKLSMRPKFDDSLQKELRRILRVRTGDTSYGVSHGLLAEVILEKNPFGPPRKEPKYGRWLDPLTYTYREFRNYKGTMDHYLTTYRKDYLWPNLPGGNAGGGAGAGAEVPKLSGQELAFYQACMQHTRPPDCRCPQYAGGEMPQLPPGKEGGWSRNEIMGPMLDPKLYPVRVGASPETPTSRYDQPNAFLDKLQSKYPMLYSILQNEASPELKQRIDRDRNKTTYQVDFCESGPGAKFEGLQRAADESGAGPCAQPMRLPGDPCRVGPKPGRKAAPRTMSKQAGGGAASDPRAKCETTSATPPLGKSEYQDGVSKLGSIIMRDKLHRR